MAYNRALETYEKSIQPDKPFAAYLGAFIDGSFQARVPTNPALAYVRHLDDTPATAKHGGKVNLDLDFTDPDNQTIPIALYYDEYDALAIYDLDPDQSGATQQRVPGVIVPSHTHNASAIIAGILAPARLPVFVGDTGGGGTQGAVPAPVTGDAVKFLKGDGTWASASGAGGGGIIYTDTAGVNFNTTTTPTSLLNYGTGSRTLGAGTALVGDVLHWHINGMISTKASGAGTGEWSVQIGSTTVVTSGALTLDDNAAAFFELVVEAAIQSVGASGVVGAMLKLYVQGFAAPMFLTGDQPLVDFTGSNLLDVTFAFSVSDSANVMDTTIAVSYIELLRP